MKHGGTLVLGALASAMWLGVALTPALTSAASPHDARPREVGPRVDEAQVRETLAALGPEFRRTETRQFVVLSDGDAAWTRTRAALLDATADRFEEAMAEMGLAAQASRHKLLCVLFNDHDRFEAFAAAQDGVIARWVGGYYAVKANRIVFFDPRTSPDFARADEKLEEARREAQRADERADRARREGRRDMAEAYRSIAQHVRNEVSGQEASLGQQASRSGASKTVHEAAHLLAFNRGLQMRSRAYPFWMSEGFATCFEPASEEDARRGRFGPGRAVPQRDRDFAEAIARGQTLPLRTLLTLEEATHDGEGVGALYAQAHSLFRYLYKNDPKALGGLFLDLSRTEQEAKGDVFISMFEGRFGSVDVVERSWRASAWPKAVAGATAEE